MNGKSMRLKDWKPAEIPPSWKHTPTGKGGIMRPMSCRFALIARDSSLWSGFIEGRDQLQLPRSLQIPWITPPGRGPILAITEYNLCNTLYQAGPLFHHEVFEIGYMAVAILF